MPGNFGSVQALPMTYGAAVHAVHRFVVSPAPLKPQTIKGACAAMDKFGIPFRYEHSSDTVLVSREVPVGERSSALEVFKHLSDTIPSRHYPVLDRIEYRREMSLLDRRHAFPQFMRPYIDGALIDLRIEREGGGFHLLFEEGLTPVHLDYSLLVGAGLMIGNDAQLFLNSLMDDCRGIRDRLPRPERISEGRLKRVSAIVREAGERAKTVARKKLSNLASSVLGRMGEVGSVLSSVVFNKGVEGQRISIPSGVTAEEYARMLDYMVKFEIPEQLWRIEQGICSLPT